MKRSRIAGLLFAGIMLFSGQATALTGNELLEKMRSRDSLDQMFVAGYVAGVISVLFSIEERLELKRGTVRAIQTGQFPTVAHLKEAKLSVATIDYLFEYLRPFCIPNGVTTGQLQDVIKGYLERTPEQRQLNAITLTEAAFKQAFPCKPSQ